MSRLERMIRRLVAQRECLNAAAEMIEGLPGEVLEIGLGKGRTYDHLRQLLPNRDVFAFDRQCVAYVDATPHSSRLILGDFRVTLPEICMTAGLKPVLAHCDFA